MRFDRVRLITLMAERDIALKELSERAGVSVGTISQIRSGKACSSKTAQALADALSVSLDLLKMKPEVRACSQTSSE